VGPVVREGFLLQSWDLDSFRYGLFDLAEEKRAGGYHTVQVAVGHAGYYRGNVYPYCKFTVPGLFYVRVFDAHCFHWADPIFLWAENSQENIISGSVSCVYAAGSAGGNFQHQF